MRFKKWPCTMQHDASDCAAAVVSTVMLRYKKESIIMKIREMIGTDAYGTTVKGIMDGLEKLNFNAKAIRTTVEQMTPDLTYPAIAQIQTEEGLNHFYVLYWLLKLFWGFWTKDRFKTFFNLTSIVESIVVLI